MDTDPPLAITPFLNDIGVMDVLSEVLERVLNDGYITETLADRMVPYLNRFMRMIKNGGESSENLPKKYEKLVE